MSNDKEFVWTDDLVKELVYKNLLLSRPDVAVILSEFKKSKETKKDYEIVSYNHFHKNYDAVDLEFVAHNYPIHSVKRLSDGEVFSVGDEIFVRETSTRKWFGKVYEFKVLNNELIVGIWQETNPAGDLHRTLSEIGKERTPLFTSDQIEEIRFIVIKTFNQLNEK